AGLRSQAADPRGGAADRRATRARGGVDVRRPYRQPLRRGDLAAVRPGLPALRGAAHQRGVGDPDRAPPDLDRKPPPARGRDRREPRCAPRSRPPRESPAGPDGRPGRSAGVPHARRFGADSGVRSAARPAPARSGPGDDARGAPAPPAARGPPERRAPRGPPPPDPVRAEPPRRGAANVTVRNVITSLRIMATFDWPNFVEKVSLIDRLFRAETEFGLMDFATRDRYRH